MSGPRPVAPADDSALRRLFAGDSEMARRMREHDWAGTPLGAVGQWPPQLRSPLDICLGSSFPIALYWGPQLVLLYNDAWSPILGGKHPWALGRPAREVWPEIWDTIGPLFEQVFASGRATRSRDQLLPMRRHGFVEECWFDYTFSPIRGADGVAGIFNAVIETTFRRIGERRTQLLRRLGEHTANAPSAAAACERAAAVFAEAGEDLPFALLYLRDGEQARLAAAAGLAAGAPAAPAVQELAHDGEWPLQAALQRADGLVVEALAQRFGGALPGGPWPEPCERALVLPIAPGPGQPPAGMLVAGISPRLALDSEYRAFVERAAAAVGAAIAGARAFEAERARAAALAEIDRAKTAFFTNVSHEFRTPLALMLGPLDELQRGLQDGAQRELAATAQRNAQRLLKLVNALLDFARVEGGRADASFEPTDLAACTAELASSFRSACQRAGLQLRVDCPPLPQPVYVDPQQWEKIVLNLLSNAFKFTLDGSIEVGVRASADGRHAELTVRDSGCGIPAAELPKLFGRFQRIEGRPGRSFEGSGIGLALVHELVRLHGGNIEAASVEGSGSVFTVRLPFGRAHLPAERVREAAAAPRRPVQAAAFVGEALQWLPADGADATADSGFGALDEPDRDALPDGKARVLVADDNADLRAYLARLLGEHYVVQTAADGLAALALAQAEPPDLIVSDAMMPGLDGFGLIERLRADPRTRTLPVIVLSARAGDESRIEGLNAGADDYLVKPFSARELLARVAAHLSAARIRREADAARRDSEALLHGALAANDACAWVWNPATDELRWSPELPRLFGLPADAPMRAELVWQRVHADDRDAVRATLARQLAGGDAIDVEFRVLQADRGWRWMQARGRRDGDGRMFGFTVDVTERRAVEAALRDSEQRYRSLVSVLTDVPWTTDAAGAFVTPQPAWCAYTGQSWEAARGFGWADALHPDDRDAVRRLWQQALDQRARYESHGRFWHAPSARWRHFVARATPLLADDGSVREWVGACTDVDDRVRAERELAAQVADLTLLHELTARLTGDRELAPLLDELLHGALALTGADKGLLSLADSARDELVLAASAGFRPAYRRLVERVPKGEGACGACYERRERILVEDTDADPLFERYRDAARVGGYRSAHATPLLARDGSVIGVLSLFRPKPGRPGERQMRLADLLARHAAGYLEHLRLLQALRGSERRFRMMADTAPAMLWVTDADNALDFISRGWFEHTGQTEAEAYRDGHGWTAMVHPDDRDAAARTFIEAAARREPFELEYRLRRADGSYRWAIDAGRPRFGDDGSWLGYIGSVIDVHERVETREALREADRRKDEFLATLAHELRNPLAPIRNALHLLKMAGAEAHAGRIHEMLERQVTHMVRLVDDLMEASRISRGRLELKREPLELADVLRTAIETSRPQIDAGRHSLAVQLPDEPLPVDGDAVRLAQVFANLLNNAARYTDDRGRIELAARRDGDQAVVSVRDNGIGIAAEQLPRLFEMFAQLDRSHTRAQGGLGIGLSLAQRLAQMHGGSVQAESDGPGRGSRFTVRLPLARHGAGDARAPAAARGLDARRILVVDDNRDAADSLGLLLRFLGAEVRVEHDGAAALAAAPAWRPSVVLLDLGMPGMDGFEVARRLRADPRLAGVKLIALTGWGQEDDRRRTRAEGFDHHLIKPVDINVLHALLASVQPQADGVRPS